jgi:hypothetical protein
VKHKVRQVLMTHSVRQVLTDKGGEFVNMQMQEWYKTQGIEHVLVGPKSSQLNLCERTHQSLVEMTKATMKDAGFPRSLWPEALRNAVYLKNRVYNKGTQGIPFEMMFGVKPDIHHIRKFGALAYVHIPVSPGRRKHQDNAKIGFVLGYAEDVVGCKVYLPEDRTAKFVADLRVSEDIMYRDRHEISVEDSDLDSLHFEQAGVDDSTDEQSDSSAMTETLCLEGGESGGEDNEPQDLTGSLPRREEMRQPQVNTVPSVEGVTVAIPIAVDTATAATPTGMEVAGCTEREDVNDHEVAQESEAITPQESTVRSESEVDEENESVVGPCGSAAGSEVPEVSEDDGDADSIASDGDDADVDVTLASVCGSIHGDDDDALLVDGAQDHEPVGKPVERVDASALLPPRQTGKRTHRSETPSDEVRVEQSADKQQPKRTRTGLREAHERRRPNYLNDYVANVVQSTAHILDKNGRPIRASNVRIPRNHRETMRSEFRDFWREAELEEMAALKAKGVIEEIPKEAVPKDVKPIYTRWVYAVKSDHQGYVIRFKARIVAFGNHQRPGIDFVETFAPVARMSSFQLLVALAAALHLKLYGGDINTAYLNALLKIRQYLRSIDGFPCEIDGHMYVVLKALYGLRQSGREWNSELNGWLLEHGYQRSMTEPCLYYKLDGESIMLVLVYVDDILVATDDEAKKCELFEALDKADGIKDQGLLTSYLGVEVEQTADRVTIRQTKYAREILETFGYLNAHAVGNPMETNARLVPLGEDDDSDTSFAYRQAIGMLMYLATGTRPDLAFAVGQLSRFVAKPSAKHVGAVKRVLRYLAGTMDFGITYNRAKEMPEKIILDGYCDSDWANDPSSRKSTTGLVFALAGGAVSWMSRRQTIVALSTAEAEYVAACEAAMEAKAESNILQEILRSQAVELRIGIDNQAAHVLATNPTNSRRTRHIELRWHYVREQVAKGAIELHKVDGNVNPADTFTKPLDKKRLKTLLQLVGVGNAH